MKNTHSHTVFVQLRAQQCFFLFVLCAVQLHPLTVFCVVSSVQNRNFLSRDLHRTNEEVWKVSESLQTDHCTWREDFC